MLLREQIGDDGVAFHFELVNMLAVAQFGPVTVVDFHFVHGRPPYLG